LRVLIEDAYLGQILQSGDLSVQALSWAASRRPRQAAWFFGDNAQGLRAADAKTGKALWHFPMHHNLRASPMNYEFDGEHISPLHLDGM